MPFLGGSVLIKKSSFGWIESFHWFWTCRHNFMWIGNYNKLYTTPHLKIHLKRTLLYGVKCSSNVSSILSLVFHHAWYMILNPLLTISFTFSKTSKESILNRMYMILACHWIFRINLSISLSSLLIQFWIILLTLDHHMVKQLNSSFSFLELPASLLESESLIW